MTESAKPTPGFRLHLGAAYYPEHWPEDRWLEDIRLMKEAGLTVTRLAEFAWSSLEPDSGIFQMEWLERAVQLLAENDIVSVLGTPTAAPPAWLTQNDAETLAVDEYGRYAQHGNRCHYCVTSPAFHTTVRRIVTALAERFGPNPNVIGWQLDNEYSRVCYCTRCQRLFQEFLKERYETLENLNQRWSTAYWSQTYTAWDQIPIPIGGHNPGLMLEFKRFTTHNYRIFQKIQLDSLRPHLPEHVWVTHNFMGWFDGFDHYDMAEDLDMASWDYYVGTGHHDYLANSATHALTRGFKRKNYWVMETQPGSVNWSGVNNMLDKGEGRVMAWQGVSHGADGILYWQWRSALGGQEQYHGTLVDQAGLPRPFYSEVQQLGEEFKKVSALLEGTVPKFRVGMLYDYESRWAIQWQKHHKDFDYVAHFNHYYRYLALRNVNVEILPAGKILDEAQLKGIKLLIAPALNIITEPLAKVLENFLKRGGHLVLTLRSGMKDEYNALLPMRQPGYLAKLAGIEVEDFYALDEPILIKGHLFDGVVRQWAERLKLTGQYVLPMAKYKKSNGWLDDQAAISVTGILGGSGLIYYIGCYLDDKNQQILIDRLLKNCNQTTLNTPADVEVRIRVRPDPQGKRENDQEVFFVMNHASHEATLWLPWLARNHLTGEVIDTELILAPYGVAVITKEETIESTGN
jgi:beta-galactosidase